MDYLIASIVVAMLILLGLVYCCCKKTWQSSAEGPDIDKGSSVNKDYPTIADIEKLKQGSDIKKGSPINKDRLTIVDIEKLKQSSDIKKDSPINKDRLTIDIENLKQDRSLRSQICGDQPTSFDLETLKNATGNFPNDKKLGEGGFGPVYQGILTDGKEIAVKKLCLKSNQPKSQEIGEQQFLNEAMVLAKLQHRNLVQIIGYCAEGDERLLVYEYLPNKSLDKFLFDPQRIKELDWGKRFDIILGIASGLAYLHEGSRKSVVHRDIKAANILLDQGMKPKIADFGLAKMFDEDETHVYTGAPAGTIGYMAPEYFLDGEITFKTDIYSFGVLLLEIVCGRQNNRAPILTKQVWESFNSKQSVDVVDKTIIEQCDKEEAMKCIHVGLLCIQKDAFRRPTDMSKVYSMLSNPTTTNLEHPTKPPL